MKIISLIVIFLCITLVLSHKKWSDNDIFKKEEKFLKQQEEGIQDAFNTNGLRDADTLVRKIFENNWSNAKKRSNNQVTFHENQELRVEIVSPTGYVIASSDDIELQVYPSNGHFNGGFNGGHGGNGGNDRHGNEDKKRLGTNTNQGHAGTNNANNDKNGDSDRNGETDRNGDNGKTGQSGQSGQNGQGASHATGSSGPSGNGASHASGSSDNKQTGASHNQNDDEGRQNNKVTGNSGNGPSQHNTGNSDNKQKPHSNQDNGDERQNQVTGHSHAGGFTVSGLSGASGASGDYDHKNVNSRPEVQKAIETNAIGVAVRPRHGRLRYYLARPFSDVEDPSFRIIVRVSVSGAETN